MRHSLPISGFGRHQVHTSEALKRLGAFGRVFGQVVGFTDVPSYGRFLWVREALRRFDRSPVRILDAGSGTGEYAFWIAEQFPAATVLALDLNARHIDICQRLVAEVGPKNLTFRRADLTAFDDRGPFDLIYSVDVLEHIADNHAVIRSLAERLSPGGALLIRIPEMIQRRRLPERLFVSLQEWAEEEHTGQHFNLTTLCDHLKVCGLSIGYAAQSSGLFGQLGFELSYVLNERFKPGYAAAIPALKALYHLDVRLGPKPVGQGNGIVVLARR
jgi:SAM-dependent methyltransferase